MLHGTMDIECTTFSVSSNQNEGQLDRISTSEGAAVYDDEKSMSEWEHIEAGNVCTNVVFDCMGEILKNDDAVFAVPMVPPLKEVKETPNDDLFDFQQIPDSNESGEEIPVIPEYLCDRITHEIFQDPVVTPSGITYERKNIEEHLNTVGNFDPITHHRLTAEEIFPDHRIRIALDEFTAMNPEVLSAVENEQFVEQELQSVEQANTPPTTEVEDSTEINTTSL